MGRFDRVLVIRSLGRSFVKQSVSRIVFLRLLKYLGRNRGI